MKDFLTFLDEACYAVRSSWRRYRFIVEFKRSMAQKEKFWHWVRRKLLRRGLRRLRSVVQENRRKIVANFQK